MKRILERIGTRLGRLIDTALGIVGGLICGLAGSSIAVAAHQAVRYPLWLLLAGCLVLLVGFMFLGLLRPQYFGCFSGPLLSAMSGGFEAKSFREGAAVVALFVALLALLLGVVFQVHLAVLLGALLLAMYAGVAPAIFPDAATEARPPSNHTPVEPR